MNALDSPIEALAINYVHFGFLAVAGNLWAWLTVVTAALSFWRIRTTFSSSRTVAKLSFPPPEEHRRPPEEATPAVLCPSPAVLGTGLDSYVAKRRFTMCFEMDATEEEEEAVEGKEVDGGCAGGGEWWSGWENVLRERNGEVGWYSCQDLSVLDGRVVRLWDEDRRLRRLGRQK